MFDSVAYSIRVGEELVSSFRGAGFATTPGQIGSAREVPTREKLEQLLPRGIAVGSGCVIDSFGNTSRQMDVVLYERDNCPVYSINRDPATTYYPCEGVIAVGEIKSSISSCELKNIFVKLASVKKLQRFAQPAGDLTSRELGLEDSIPFRQYGSLNVFQGSKSEEYRQDAKPTDQVFGFALAGTLTLSPQTLCNKFAGLAKLTGNRLSPNLIVTLEGGILCPLLVSSDRHNPKMTVSVQGANGVYYVQNPNGGFQFLLSRLYFMYRSGRTVDPVAFDRYFAKDGTLTLPLGGTLVAFP